MSADDQDGAERAPEGLEDDGLPPLAPHLANRFDRPRPQADIVRGRSQARLILLLLFAALPFVVLVVVILNSLASGPPDTSQQGVQDSRNEVTRYCTYKARNDGQYDDCLRRTDPRVVRREQSNAARYARADLTRCLPDAGPRCTLR
jgi:hypothetical protein